MENKMRLFLVILIFASSGIFAQVTRDQDLVTLKNGYQLLGYVVEQYPGKLIKVYRPEENDTSEVALSDISKLTKIWVQPFSAKEIQTEKQDSIPVVPGRFNNKRYVFSIHYNLQWRDVESKERRGLGVSFLRNFNNRYLGGVSAIVFGTQNVRPQYAGFDSNNSSHRFRQFQMMFSNYYRLGKNVQNSRVSALFSLHTGWVFEGSESNYTGNLSPFSVNYEKAQGAWILNAGMQFRINPDNQSGICIEPGYLFLPQNIRQYAGLPGEETSIYLGFRRQVNHLFSLRMSYFF
jgi:hypothetical protein